MSDQPRQPGDEKQPPAPRLPLGLRILGPVVATERELEDALTAAQKDDPNRARTKIAREIVQWLRVRFHNIGTGLTPDKIVTATEAEKFPDDTPAICEVSEILERWVAPPKPEPESAAVSVPPSARSIANEIHATYVEDATLPDSRIVGSVREQWIAGKIQSALDAARDEQREQDAKLVCPDCKLGKPIRHLPAEKMLPAGWFHFPAESSEKWEFTSLCEAVELGIREGK